MEDGRTMKMKGVTLSWAKFHLNVEWNLGFLYQIFFFWEIKCKHTHTQARMDN